MLKSELCNWLNQILHISLFARLAIPRHPGCTAQYGVYDTFTYSLAWSNIARRRGARRCTAIKVYHRSFEGRETPGRRRKRQYRGGGKIRKSATASSRDKKRKEVGETAVSWGWGGDQGLAALPWGLHRSTSLGSPPAARSTVSLFAPSGGLRRGLTTRRRGVRAWRMPPRALTLASSGRLRARVSSCRSLRIGRCRSVAFLRHMSRGDHVYCQIGEVQCGDRYAQSRAIFFFLHRTIGWRILRRVSDRLLASERNCAI